MREVWLRQNHKKCLAMGQQCAFCKKMNHYSKFCRSKDIHNLQELDDPGDSEDDSSFFVYSVGSNNVPEDEQFYETVEVQDTKIRFQLDSGAKGNVMSLKTYSNLKCGHLPPLKKTRTVLISLLWNPKWSLCSLETPALSLVC